MLPKALILTDREKRRGSQDYLSRDSRRLELGGLEDSKVVEGTRSADEKSRKNMRLKGSHILNTTAMNPLQRKGYLLASHSFLPALLASVLFVASDLCFAGDADTSSTDSEEQELALTELLDKISLRTGYQIELISAWPNKRVTAPLKGLPLRVTLKRILTELNSESHALVFDEKAKTVTIILMQSDIDNNSVNRRDSAGETHLINLPFPVGDPSISPRELAAITAEYRKNVLNLDPNTEISPPSDYGPGLTLAEFESIKRDHEMATNNLEAEIEITPPSQHGRGMTATELDDIKALHNERLTTSGLATVASPPTMAALGMTISELGDIKKAHAQTLVPGDTAVTPASVHGPGLTLDEVDRIKAAHEKSTALHQESDYFGK